MDKRSPGRILLVFVLMALLGAGCFGPPPADDFSAGHEWIVPRPAAQIHLSVVDSQGQPVNFPLLWATVDDEKYTTDGGFVGYDPRTGYRGDAAGRFVIAYLGEKGGGYEAPMGSRQPRHRLLVEGEGFRPASVDLDSLLFVQSHRRGTTTGSFGGQEIVMISVSYTVTLESR